MNRWYWLSFCDPEKPEGSQFLGVVIAEGDGMADVLTKLWQAGLNPGGEVASVLIPPGYLPASPWRWRLLTRREAESL